MKAKPAQYWRTIAVFSTPKTWAGNDEMFAKLKELRSKHGAANVRLFVQVSYGWNETHVLKKMRRRPA